MTRDEIEEAAAEARLLELQKRITNSRREHYRNLGSVLGQDYYRLATVLESAEAGGYGKLSKQSLDRYRNKIAKAAAALDKAHDVLGDALTMQRELLGV